MPATRETTEILIDGRVYDVTNFATRHPGGSIIKFANGTDASASFHGFHFRSSAARKMLKSLPSREATAADAGRFYVGGETDDGGRAMLADFARLREELVAEGFYEPDYWHTAFRLTELVLMHVVGYLLCFRAAQTVDALGLPSLDSFAGQVPLAVVGLALGDLYSAHAAFWSGMCLLGLAQGRCGWYMHEGGHYSLTGSIWLDRQLQMFTYGFGCGLSGAYWRNQHNKHHAAPQKLRHDVDLNTLPLVAFNAKIAARVRNPLVRGWIKYQAALFVPVITCLVTLWWQFFLHPRHALRIKNGTELCWMGLRYATWYWLCVVHGGYSLGQMCIYYVLYCAVGGAYIFSTFAVSHTHLPVVDEDEHRNWIEYAAKHTVNATPSPWCNWWMGYLNFQIEHHLFPSMPQYRFTIIHPRVKALFIRHGLVYDVRPLSTLLAITFRNLCNVPIEANNITKGATCELGPDGRPWNVILHGKRLVVGNWLQRHPGGDKVLRIFHNRDATEQFEATHSEYAKKKLAAFLRAAEPVETSASRKGLSTAAKKALRRNEVIKADYATLVQSFVDEGLFAAQPMFQFFLTLWVFGLWAAGAAVLKLPELAAFCAGRNVAPAFVGWVTWFTGLTACGFSVYAYAGAVLMFAGMQQAGWLGHDYAHHSVLKDGRKQVWMNDAIACCCGWLQGYELMWWKARHNTHHVATNETGNDPDIKTSPVFTFLRHYVGPGNADVLEALKSSPAIAAGMAAAQKLQTWYFLPSIGFLHLFWRIESILYIVKRLGKMKLHALSLVLHYVALHFLYRDVGWAPLLVAWYLKGLGTGCVVFATHYAEERLGKGASVHEEVPDVSLSLAEQTVRTSRNISSRFWAFHMFTGMLSYQIEHHLFPMMPRCNYFLVKPHVEAFCKKHGLPYRQDSMWNCLKRVMKALEVNGTPSLSHLD